MIVIIYDQSAREIEERPARKLGWQKVVRQGGGGMVLTGDFTALSQRCDLRYTELRDAAYWEEILE